MKKTLLAAALVTGFAGVAHAETSVTLYGLVDAGIGYSQTKVTQGDAFTKTRDIGLINGVKNGNRWGLKGTEDLGNGTSAIFQLESGFDLGNGRSSQGGRLFGRKAIVGLTGESWGTLTLGRQYNVADDFISPIDPFGTGFGQAGVTDGAFGDSPSARMDNSIKYMTPDFAGFKAAIGYAGKNTKTTSEDFFGNEGETRDTSNWITAGLAYNNGPIAVAASYDRFRSNARGIDEDTGLAWETKGTTHMWNLFGSYDFEVVKLHLGYGQIRGSVANDVVSEAGVGSVGLNSALADFAVRSDGLNYTQTNGYRQQSWMAGLSAPVGDDGKVLFSYQGNTSKNTGEAFDGVKGKLHLFSLGYVHNLSKRTSLYAIASYGTGKLKFDNQENVKLKSTLVGVGMQHRF
ncbi:porin [Advenella mimigardefordensis]|uniref:Outer membrane porin protein n=1 Tax=Advenella mimigardefordensis (strain DSM 17166 / LMG 22922 / DPN7) TaxID=1247726 RepID=W0PCD1_ADVMD|nr:porin [Advenella mimigardefordensis]AHG64534.1 outer membrane porin protein [Advenella mimigardefordensis DPN7]